MINFPWVAIARIQMKLAFGVLFHYCSIFSMETGKIAFAFERNNDGNADIEGENFPWDENSILWNHDVKCAAKEKKEKKKDSLDEPSGLINFRRFFSFLTFFSLSFMRKKKWKALQSRIYYSCCCLRVRRKKGILSRSFCCRKF